MTKIVFVKGSIIAESGCHLAKNLECLARIEEEQTADIVINGDLYLNKGKTLTTYYSYKAQEGITAINGNIGCFSKPLWLQENLSKELEKIVALSKNNYQGDLVQIEYKSLYGAIFGCFEAFLTMLLTNMILGDKDYYDRFLLYINAANYKEVDVVDKIVKAINNFTAHNFKNLKNIYENIFEIDFPDYTKLIEVTKRRHDIIHRSGWKVVGNHTELITISCEEIANLVELCNDFVKALMHSMANPIRKWEE